MCAKRFFLSAAIPLIVLLQARGQSLAQQKIDEANKLNQLGIVEYKKAHLDEALSTFERVRSLYGGDAKGEAVALSEIAMCYAGLGQSHRALDYLEKALPKWHEVADRENEASTLGKEGDVY